MPKLLPLGTSDFQALRLNNEIYVDKTDLIFQLAKGRGKIFLARPRRFGKSLLISTFESLFKSGLQNFRGLAIEDLWEDKLYPVVRLDFSKLKGYDSVEFFREAFFNYLQESFYPLGFRYDASRTSVLAQLDSWTQTLETSSLVILIDEYDAPLTERLHDDSQFNQVRDILSQFFAILKSNEGCLRFFFMTGITKFSNTSIFSAFNNLQDISMNPIFGTLLGYTQEEIIENFSEYLTSAAQKLKVSEQDLLDQLKLHYDGFCFDSSAKTHVYCPWSVLNFLNYPELGFQNYWYKSGGQPTVLLKFLVNHALEKPVDYAEDKLIRLSDLNTARQYDEICLDALLTQAGYLSISEVLKNGYAVLTYPNKEVAVSMAQLYADELLKGRPLEHSRGPLIADVMASGRVEDVIDVFNKTVTSIDYSRYPITDESTCRAYLQVLLIGAAMLPRVEVHNALGRSDLEVEIGTRHWVFKFKFAHRNSQVQSLLSQGLEQLKANRYGKQSTLNELIRVALVFSEEDRKFTAWQCV